MGLHFVLCSICSECIGLHFVLWTIYLFIFSFLRRCFKNAKFSAIIQNPMEKPVGMLSREPRATLTSGLANTRHPSTTLYCKNTCSSWMIMHEFILYSAVVFIERGGAYKSFGQGSTSVCRLCVFTVQPRPYSPFLKQPVKIATLHHRHLPRTGSDGKFPNNYNLCIVYNQEFM